MERLKRLGIGASKFAPHVVTGGGIAALAGGKKKKASAIEKLAEERAWELANEAGYVDEQGNLTVPEQQEKTAASELETTVDTMALQMLEQAGVPVEWNE